MTIVICLDDGMDVKKHQNAINRIIGHKKVSPTCPRPPCFSFPGDVESLQKLLSKVI